MNPAAAPPAPVKYVWKALSIRHAIGGGVVFLALWAPLRALPGDFEGIALLAALTVMMSRPEGRQWLMAIFSGLAAVGLLSTGGILVSLAHGNWPPAAGAASDLQLRMGAAATILACPVAVYAAHALARQPVLAQRDMERDRADLHPWQMAALVGAGLAAMFGIILAPWPFESVMLGPGAFLLLLLIIYCGGVVALAWPGAVGARRALLGRFVLALLIGLAAWPVGEGAYALIGKLWKGLAGLPAVVAIFGAAGYLAWWQLKHFAHRTGTLRLVPAGAGGPKRG